MKILYSPQKTGNRYELEVVAVLNQPITEEMKVATGTDVKLEWRDNLPADYQLTKAQYLGWYDFLNSVVSFVTAVGFEITDQYQSKQSYSYYVEFKLTFYDGMEPDNADVLVVKFRISNHNPLMKINEDDTSNISPNRVFRSYVVDGITHEHLMSALRGIKDACLNIKAGMMPEAEI